MLLVVFGQKDMTMGLFNVAARNALANLQRALERQRKTAASDAGEDTATD